MAIIIKVNDQKQKTGGVLLKMCPYIFCIIHRQTRVHESLFNKLQAKTRKLVFSCNFSTGHLRTTASVMISCSDLASIDTETMFSNW